MWQSRVAPILMAALWVSACATPSSHIMLGTARPAISPDDVKVYTAAPSQPFDEIALLNASSSSAFGDGGQASVDEVIARMKTDAAKLGANGLILGDLGERQTGSLGTAGGSDSYSRHSALGVGVSGSAGVFQKTGKGTAIFVPKGLCILGCDN